MTQAVVDGSEARSRPRLTSADAADALAIAQRCHPEDEATHKADEAEAGDTANAGDDPTASESVEAAQRCKAVLASNPKCSKRSSRSITSAIACRRCWS